MLLNSFSGFYRVSFSLFHGRLSTQWEYKLFFFTTAPWSHMLVLDLHKETRELLGVIQDLDLNPASPAL